MMYFFFVMCCFVNYVSAISKSELLFETDNKCGCYSFEHCPILLKPNCSIEDTNYQDLYKQNSPSSISPELCSKWFLEGFKKQLIMSENGTLKISLLFSSMLDQEIVLSVHLRYQNQSMDIYNSSVFHLLDMKHSTKYVEVSGISTGSCNKTIEILFPFVFSGYYQLYMNSDTRGISDGCMSRPFFLDTSYKMTRLDNINMTHDTSYLSQSEYLKFRFVGEGLNEPKSILIWIKNLITENVVKEAHLTSVQRGDCCHGIERPENDYPHNMTYCPCKWENDMTIDCTFRQIKNGNYCVIIQFIDQRCDPDSLWTETGCNWGFNKEANGQITPIEPKPYTVNNLYPIVILCCLFVILGIAGVMLTVRYIQKGKKKKHNTVTIVESIVEKSPFIGKEEILLLYPRECDKFMTAMTLFRMLLKESCGCKVHDAWDEKIFDKVAESIETWSLPLIEDEKTKIIVVLTECSKIIEESCIGDNHYATYRDPKAFDKVFAQSIKALNEYFAVRSDSYRRVFVVRLDETPVIDFSFNFNRATVYILPHGLQTLVNDIKNGKFTAINKENQVKLTVAIQEYQAYKQQYINYLHDILNINNNCKIIKCLKNGIIR